MITISQDAKNKTQQFPQSQVKESEEKKQSAMQNLWQEQFSFAYIRAVAAVAGFQVVKPEVDVAKIDLEISAVDENLYPDLPKIAVQVKCTTQNDLREECLAFELDVNTYQSLCWKTYIPRLLIVVTVPEKPDDWLQQTETELALRYCGYFLSLVGKPESNKKESVTVYLPRANIFRPQTLRAMMTQLQQGERL